jgi:hypothetical protein
MRWAEHVACMEKMRNSHSVLVAEPEGKKPLDGLDGRGCRVPFPAGAENFSLHHRV